MLGREGSFYPSVGRKKKNQEVGGGGEPNESHVSDVNFFFFFFSDVNFLMTLRVQNEMTAPLHSASDTEVGVNKLSGETGSS